MLSRKDRKLVKHLRESLGAECANRFKKTLKINSHRESERKHPKMWKIYWAIFYTIKYSFGVHAVTDHDCDGWSSMVYFHIGPFRWYIDSQSQWDYIEREFAESVTWRDIFKSWRWDSGSYAID